MKQYLKKLKLILTLRILMSSMIKLTFNKNKSNNLNWIIIKKMMKYILFKKKLEKLELDII